MNKKIIPFILIILIILLLLAVWQIPWVQSRLGWRLDAASVYIHSLFHPIGQVPTPEKTPEISPDTQPVQPDAIQIEPAVTITPTVTTSSTEQISPTSTPPTPTAQPENLPESFQLISPEFEAQDWNNCGPASLSMFLNFYNWGGSQYTISDQIKPERSDRNVNMEELNSFVYQNIWWLRSIVRVNGNLTLIKKLISNGYPVMVEKSMLMEEAYWFNDDRWAGHYLLLTGYDDSEQLFITQDSYIGSDQTISYQDLDSQWQSFNRVYLLVYPTEEDPKIQSILGNEWDENFNRINAISKAENEIAENPQNSFAWFNLGTNLVYFQRYSEAVNAFDQARSIGLPQRMFRYQFSPFFAYFYAGENESLQSLLDFAIETTPNSEEALLWSGWLAYRYGDIAAAESYFLQSLEAHPDNTDALYALDYIRN